MLEILSLILSDGDPGWCRSVPNWERGPWLETLLGLRRARGGGGGGGGWFPRTQDPPRGCPPARPPPQVIYTVRDPRDVLVSLFHFSRVFRPYRDPGSLEQFLGQFLEG
ncbi:ST2B1 Sulfotransferase, partial [Bucorvus abyssinicus]|nr:ST2B1 Sulfotransferase [Bucorvus abyssinicus]